MLKLEKNTTKTNLTLEDLQKVLIEEYQIIKPDEHSLYLPSDKQLEKDILCLKDDTNTNNYIIVINERNSFLYNYHNYYCAEYACFILKQTKAFAIYKDENNMYSITRIQNISKQLKQQCNNIAV